MKTLLSVSMEMVGVEPERLIEMLRYSYEIKNEIKVEHYIDNQNIKKKGKRRWKKKN